MLLACPPLRPSENLGLSSFLFLRNNCFSFQKAVFKCFPGYFQVSVGLLFRVVWEELSPGMANITAGAWALDLACKPLSRHEMETVCFPLFYLVFNKENFYLQKMNSVFKLNGYIHNYFSVLFSFENNSFKFNDKDGWSRNSPRNVVAFYL